MQLDEQIELAFKAGGEWVLDNAYAHGDYVELDKDFNEGIKEYINGNLQSTESAAVLDEGSS